jgi:hypothetical protein
LTPLEWKRIVLGRGSSDARQPKDFVRLSSIILDDFAFQHMALNTQESEACSIAKTLLNTHVAQQHIDSTYLKVQVIGGHAWWKKGVQKLFWNYVRMILPLHDVIVNAVPHVVPTFYHGEDLVIKECCVLVGRTQNDMVSEVRESVLVQDITKGCMNEGQTVVDHTYLFGEQIYGIITNTISNIKEPFSKEWISGAHVLTKAKCVGMEKRPHWAHAQACSYLMGIGATQDYGEGLAPVPT